MSSIASQARAPCALTRELGLRQDGNSIPKGEKKQGDSREAGDRHGLEQKHRADLVKQSFVSHME